MDFVSVVEVWLISVRNRDVVVAMGNFRIIFLRFSEGVFLNKNSLSWRL